MRYFEHALSPTIARSKEGSVKTEVARNDGWHDEPAIGYHVHGADNMNWDEVSPARAKKVLTRAGLHARAAEVE